MIDGRTHTQIDAGNDNIQGPNLASDINKSPIPNTNELAHWDRDKIDAILQVKIKLIFLNENGCILIQISLNLVDKGPFVNKASLVQVKALLH